MSLARMLTRSVLPYFVLPLKFSKSIYWKILMIPQSWLRRPLRTSLKQQNKTVKLDRKSVMDSHGGVRTMSLDSERLFHPETCMKCRISWIMCLPRDTQLGTSVERLIGGSDLKISSATCWYILEVVDDYHNMGQYLNLVGPEFPLSFSFSFYDPSNLARTTFWRQVQETVNQFIMESHWVYRIIALDIEQRVLPESCI